MSHRVEIDMTGHGRGKVWLDGNKLDVVSVRFSAEVDSVNVVEIVLLAERIAIAGPANVVRRAPSYFEFNAQRRHP